MPSAQQSIERLARTVEEMLKLEEPMTRDEWVRLMMLLEELFAQLPRLVPRA